MAGMFVAGIGAGVAFDSVVSLEPNNVASREVIDRSSPSTEICAANGASAMVFDQRVFLSFNPFNVYVSQPEVKPGCVLRRSNWSVLERRNLVGKEEVESCKRGMNTFAFVGDLESGDPKVLLLTCPPAPALCSIIFIILFHNAILIAGVVRVPQRAGRERVHARRHL
jgi:hypothetical protein